MLITSFYVQLILSHNLQAYYGVVMVGNWIKLNLRPKTRISEVF